MFAPFAYPYSFAVVLFQITLIGLRPIRNTDNQPWMSFVPKAIFSVGWLTFWMFITLGLLYGVVIGTAANFTQPDKAAMYIL